MRSISRLGGGLSLAVATLFWGCDGDRPKAPQVNETELNTTASEREGRTALRFSDESPGESLDKIRIDALIEALVPDALPYTSARGNGDTRISVALLSENEAAPSAQLLQKLGFQKNNDEPDGKLLEHTVKGADKTGFVTQLREARAAAAKHVALVREHMERATQPGLLLSESRAAGGAWFLPVRLVFTGHPLDLAMPDTAERGSERYFLPVRLAADHAALNLKEGARAFVRGGRVYIGKDGALRVRAGTLDELQPVPSDARRVIVATDGRVIANLLDGTAKPLGRLSLAKLSRPEGDGDVFVPPADGQTEVSHFPGEDATPGLKPGHLEFPEIRAAQATAELSDQLRVMRLINGLEIALAVPARVDLPGGEVAPHATAENNGAEIRRLDIMADLPLASAHLKALNFVAETLQGRTSIPVGARGDDLQRSVTALSKVLQGLQRRMAVCQENYTKANRTRDDQNRLNPYRRKIVKIGNEGEILVAEDPAEFRKELKPESGDAGPDGFVRYPNVSRSLEQADFERAAEEYRLVRDALERVAPGVVFPEPPLLQLETKAP